VTEVSTRAVPVNGIELNVHEAGPPDGPLVVLAHGFPELGYSWRHQLPALADAGFHVLAPDQRGYGRSSRPDEIADYDITHLTGDLLGLLDDANVEKAVFVGHDWGALVVWQMSLMHPDRVAGVAGMSVPFIPRGPLPPVEQMRHLFADNFFYIVYFQDPGVADAELGGDPARTMRRLLCGASVRPGDDLASAFANDGRGFIERIPEPDGLPDWLSQAELDHYVAEFSRTGFTGGLNWYRNLDRNWQLTEGVAATVAVPSLFIGGSLDPVLVLTPPTVMDGFVNDHRGSILIDGAGHWVQQERPAEVNAALIEFATTVTSGNESKEGNQHE
jgi:pimeloyl-ACP methyl ester carboxylesterase